MCKLSKCWAAVMVAVIAVCIYTTGAQEMTNKQCLDCHGDKDLTKTNETAKAISLFVDAAKLAASNHATNSCVSCHTDLKSTHPDDNVAAKPVDCARCHRNASETYSASV